MSSRTQPPAALIPATQDSALQPARKHLALVGVNRHPTPTAREVEVIDVEFVPAYDLQNERLIFIFRQCRASLSRELELSYCL